MRAFLSVGIVAYARHVARLSRQFANEPQACPTRRPPGPLRGKSAIRQLTGSFSGRQGSPGRMKVKEAGRQYTGESGKSEKTAEGWKPGKSEKTAGGWKPEKAGEAAGGWKSEKVREAAAGIRDGWGISAAAAWQACRAMPARVQGTMRRYYASFPSA